MNATINRSWEPEKDTRYDEVLARTCAAELTYLAGCTIAERLAFLCDTRAVHKRLYQEFAPVDFPEYAGNYRGTPDTNLLGREVQAIRISDGELYSFMPSAMVEKNLQTLSNNLFIPHFVSSLSEKSAVDLATKAFVIFGQIHPYLDGNGHIQRLMFATIISECPNLELCTRWTVHPRPYAEDFAKSLEEKDVNRRLRDVQMLLQGYVRKK